jgi:hypothetical protein
VTGAGRPRDERDTPPDAEGAPEGGAAPAAGGISIGALEGGAVAAGRGARAEDRSGRGGPEPRPAVPPGEVPPPVPGGISIGTMSGGAAASGPGAVARDASVHHLDATPQLRAALAALRVELASGALDGQVPGAVAADTVAEVTSELAATQAEIGATGRVRPERLQRLRDRLELGGMAAAGLSSVAGVVQQIVQLLGGRG